MTVRTYRDLKVWQMAHKLVIETYVVAKDYPKEEKYGLVSQIRRAAVSVPTNIVEGFKRRTTKDYIHFINIADASLEETGYLLYLSFELGYLKGDKYKTLVLICEEVGRMLGGLEKSLRSKL